MSTAALAALRTAYPSGKITVAATPWSQPALQDNPDVDAVIPFPETHGLHGIRALRSFASDMRDAGFDAVLVFDRSPLVNLVPCWMNVPVRAGLDSKGRGFLLTHKTPVRPLRHEALLYLDVVRALGVPAPDPALKYEVAPEDAAWAADRLAAGKTWIALGPGGGANPGSELTGKRWPAPRFAEVASRLIAEGRHVVLVGGPDDSALARAVKQRLEISDGGNILDLAGETTFGQLAAVLQRCSLFLGNDTGPMHLAVAVGTPVVAVFGPSRPEMYGPFSPRSEVIYHGEECRRCTFKGGLVEDCLRSYACMQAAGVDEVWAAVQRQLDKTDNGSPEGEAPLAGSLGDVL